VKFHWWHDDEVRWELRNEANHCWGSVTNTTHGYVVGHELQPPQSYARLDEGKAYVERLVLSKFPNAYVDEDEE
jgi:hypothetical protein